MKRICILGLTVALAACGSSSGSATSTTAAATTGPSAAGDIVVTLVIRGTTPMNGWLNCSPDAGPPTEFSYMTHGAGVKLLDNTGKLIGAATLSAAHEETSVEDAAFTCTWKVGFKDVVATDLNTVQVDGEEFGTFSKASPVIERKA